MKKVVCTKCGSENILITEQLNPNDDISIRKYFTDAYISGFGLCYCEDCNDHQKFRVIDVPDEKTNPWRCAECGSLDVEVKVWADSNTDKITAQDNIERNDLWCKNCEGHTRQKRQSELMADIEDWFANHLCPDDIEVIIGLERDDFTSDEEFDAVCRDKWGALDVEGKIRIWHELTRDKSMDS